MAAIPAFRTGRLSYVDIAWPWGLFFIGVSTLTTTEGFYIRRIAIGVAYLFMGGRMGLGALKAL
jgi:steroid 5-alpha reductase family enzyme